MEDLKSEMRHAIQFCVRLDESPSTTYAKMQQAYGDQCLSKSTVFEWHKRFREGRTTAADDPRSGRPSTSTSQEIVARCSELVEQDRRRTVDYLSQCLNISTGSTHSILVDNLQMRRVCARWVPRLLTVEQKATRVTLCNQMLRRYRREGEAFLQKIVTVDESWMHHFEPETKMQSSIWKHSGSPPPKKALVRRSAGKVMHMVFLDRDGLVYDHEVPPHTTVTSAYYSQVLKVDLKRHIRAKRPEKVQNGWLLHHDNAPAHTAHLTVQTLNELDVEVLAHPPYSPDLAPCDFWLFPTLKKELRGQHFASNDAVTAAVRVKLRDLCSNGLQHVFEAWVKRWESCVEAEGSYFEKE